ncbi:UPF0280 family protein [Desulfosediminicola flagellatus]|uniref:UPF0280 family protein n=1 Tax=Desulfosediminicola flagellatus TaxID=2569541 RepID=UPI001C3CB361|nr:UPF0280 family protein [Desulfosediminicola flagellatus]
MRSQSKKKEPESYVEREYRVVAAGNELVSSLVRVAETDLHIRADVHVEEQAKGLVLEARLQIERYIHKHPEFLSALSPLPADSSATPLIADMMSAGQKAGVGPMAAVAGAVAGFVGRRLLASGVQEVIVENGGDIYLHRKEDCTVGIFAGESPLSYNIGIRITKDQLPCGVCTSSGTVGHSLSFGIADSVTVVAGSIALADAAATRLGNEVGKTEDRAAAIQHALACARQIDNIHGVVIICDELLGAAGDVELVRL